MTINELVVKNEDELNIAEKNFIQAHNTIITAGVLIQNGFVSLAKNLKLIRDEKLYLTIDCSSFEEYSEKILGIKKTQAYKYIQVLENLGEEFSTRVEKVGITKLALISSLTFEERQEIVETNNLEEVSVSELKEQIKQLKQEKETELEKLKSEKDNEIVKFQNKIDKLKADLKSEKEKPVEKIIETVQDPEQQKKIELLENQVAMKEKLIKQRDDRLQELQANITISSSEELAKFKVLFENVQSEIRMMRNLINSIPAEKQDGCKKALKAIGEQLC